MCFIYHFKQARPLFNGSSTHPTNIQHGIQEWREKTVSLSLLPCPNLGFLGPCPFWGRKDFVERDCVSLSKWPKSHRKPYADPSLALPMLIHASHGDVKGHSLKMEDQYLKVICGEMASWAYTPVLSTQKQNMTHNSRVGQSINQKNREYGIEYKRRWEINAEEVRSRARGVEEWYVTR